MKGGKLSKTTLCGLVTALCISCAPTTKNVLARTMTNALGATYMHFEKDIIYQDSTVLGIPIDEELQVMSRKELCSYIDSLAGTEGFYKLQSTTKIRLGAQLFKEYHKNEYKGNDWMESNSVCSNNSNTSGIRGAFRETSKELQLSNVLRSTTSTLTNRRNVSWIYDEE